MFESGDSKHVTAATQALISLTVGHKTTVHVPGVFTSLWPPALRSHCSCQAARCRMCRRPAASAWCSGSSSTESRACPSPGSLDSPTQSNSWSLLAQQHPRHRSTANRLRSRSLPLPLLLLPSLSKPFTGKHKQLLSTSERLERVEKATLSRSYLLHCASPPLR